METGQIQTLTDHFADAGKIVNIETEVLRKIEDVASYRREPGEPGLLLSVEVC